MEKRIMVTLTPAESKRLIAKWVAVMPMVKRALEDGIVSLQMSSSNGYIYEEITGKHINKSNHMCGFLSAAGGCGAYLPDVIKRVKRNFYPFHWEPTMNFISVWGQET